MFRLAPVFKATELELALNLNYVTLINWVVKTIIKPLNYLGEVEVRRSILKVF